MQSGLSAPVSWLVPPARLLHPAPGGNSRSAVSGRLFCAGRSKGHAKRYSQERGVSAQGYRAETPKTGGQRARFAHALKGNDPPMAIQEAIEHDQAAHQKRGHTRGGVPQPEMRYDMCRKWGGATVRRMHLLRVSVAVVLLLFLLMGCGPSKKQLEEQVMSMFQEKMDTDTQFKAYSLRVVSITLVSSGKNTYDGMAKLRYKGQEYDAPITVTSDGKTVMFQTKPGAFVFLLQ